MIQVDIQTLFFAAIFTNNILLTNFLGLCPFLSISREVRSSLGLGIAVVFVRRSPESGELAAALLAEFCARRVGLAALRAPSLLGCAAFRAELGVRGNRLSTL